MYDLIETRVDDVLVKGRFLYRSDGELEVGIDEPFAGFVATLRVTAMNDGPASLGLTKEEEIRKGVELLKALYAAARHFDEYREQILGAYRNYAGALRLLDRANDALSDTYFDLAKEQLANDLALGRIAYDELESRMNDLRVMHSRYHERSHDLAREFFDQNFPEDLPDSLRKQILVRLRRLGARSAEP